VPSMLSFRGLVLILAFAAGAVAAQTASDSLGRVSAEVCAPLADDPSDVLRERLNEQKDSALTSLLIDAVIRQCQAIGALPPPERPGEEGTRNTNASTVDNEADRLAAEALYLVETAMQIDPDAANDLLRRLLGPRPSDDG
jgi:hypothetical protein